MSFGVRNTEIESLLKYLGTTLKALMPEGWGFSLQIFSFGSDGSMFYISSAKRDDMIKSLEEMIVKLKGESNETNYDKH
jgi:hypothetical protein